MKQMIPRRSTRIIPRPCLEKLLTAPAVSCILIKAGSGFGKTSVMADLVQRLEGTVVWYTLDFSDNDLHCLETGLEQLWARTKDNAEQSYIILDNLQVISCGEVLQYIFMRHRNSGDKEVLISLTSGAIPKAFLPFLLRGEGLLLTEDDLRLTPEEVRSHMAEGIDLPWDMIQKLTRDMYGWPLGIRCAMEFLRVGDWNPGAGELPWERILQETMLSQYLDEFVWNESPEEIQVFFRHTSIFHEFTWEMCQAVLSGRLTRRTFETVTRERGLVKRIPEKQDTFQYSRVFQIYLCRMLSEQERKEDCRRAALWFYERMDFQSMTAYAIRGGQKYLLVMALEQWGAVLLRQGDRNVLREMASYLEREAVLIPPGASGIMAQYFYSQDNLAKMEEYLNAADRSLGKENQYGSYRRLYQGLAGIGRDPAKYRRQIYDALFFLKDSGAPLPFLRERERSILDGLMAEEKAWKEQKKLRVYTFGTFRVILEGEKRGLAWRTRKGRELFAYLLDLDGAAADRNDLIRVLWPEEIPANAVAMLHNMIYNMRKELSACGMDKIVLHENKRYCLRMDRLVCDLPPIRRAAGLVQGRKTQELRKEYEIFLTYWGSYLEDIDNIWAERRRRYYDDIYIRGCRILAEQFTREMDYETAALFYRNILMLDPYSEKTAEKLLFLYGEEKEWEKMRQCFSEIKGLLERDLGILPGEEISAVYHRYIK